MAVETSGSAPCITKLRNEQRNEQVEKKKMDNENYKQISVQNT